MALVGKNNITLLKNSRTGLLPVSSVRQAKNPTILPNNALLFIIYTTAPPREKYPETCVYRVSKRREDGHPHRDMLY